MLEDGEVGGGVAGEFVWVAEEDDAAVVIADGEVAGDDEAVAGVVAFAAEDDDGAVDAETFEDVDAAAAGVFHEDEAGDAELVDRDAVDGAGLFAVEDGRGHAARLLRDVARGNSGAENCRYAAFRVMSESSSGEGLPRLRLRT